MCMPDMINNITAVYLVADVCQFKYMQHNDFHSDFVDKSFDKLSPVDFAQEKWKLVYPVANASCILSMYFLASRESGPMMEIVG